MASGAHPPIVGDESIQIGMRPPCALVCVTGLSVPLDRLVGISCPGISKAGCPRLSFEGLLPEVEMAPTDDYYVELCSVEVGLSTFWNGPSAS